MGGKLRKGHCYGCDLRDLGLEALGARIKRLEVALDAAWALIDCDEVRWPITDETQALLETAHTMRARALPPEEE